jgi:energy-coupling factor transporter ATP-binding protein EcfA2
VGLIYGPSGCGKSSLVKAGLLPRLAENVIAVYVEAAPEETESRLLRGLQKQLPNLPPLRGLIETLTLLRQRNGPKVLIVVDQFRAVVARPTAASVRSADLGPATVRWRTLTSNRHRSDDFAMAVSRHARPRGSDRRGTQFCHN